MANENGRCSCGGNVSKATGFCVQCDPRHWEELRRRPVRKSDESIRIRDAAGRLGTVTALPYSATCSSRSLVKWDDGAEQRWNGGNLRSDWEVLR